MMVAVTTIALLVLLFGASTTVAAVQDYAQAWTVADHTPHTAGPPIDPSFPGFAFEVSSFYNYAIDANGDPNVFSQNLINEVIQRTGGSPILRVGGTSGDIGSFNNTGLMEVPVNRPATHFRPAFHAPFLEVGEAYFKAFKSFPNASFILMVPLRHRNTTNSIAWAKAALANIHNLDALEVGNEPDFYPWFTTKHYIHAFNTMREKLQEAIPRLQNHTIFQAIDKAWQSSRVLPIADVQEALNKTGAIKQYAYHYYQSKFAWSHKILEREIANHTWTVRGMSSFKPHIHFLHRNGHGHVPFLMDEVGANMLQKNGHNSLATALWGVDYQLHCMAIGVSRVNWQQIVMPGFNHWQPVHSKWGPPMVRANFYSLPFVADFIGKNRPKVNEVQLLGGSDTLAAYTAWENGELMRIAIINLKLWTGKGHRPCMVFKISGLADNIASATVKYLSAAGGSLANDTLTYAGLQWTYESRGKAIRRMNNSKTIAVKNRTLQLTVQAGSAVLITFEAGAYGGNGSETSGQTSSAASVATVIETRSVIVMKTVTM